VLAVGDALLKKAVIDNWQGHQPATSRVLLKLFERASRGGSHFSRAERVLATACEFWAAAQNRTLSEHLGNSAIKQMQAAEESFAAIGLVNTATILRLGRLDLTSLDSPGPLRTVAARIEETLTHSADPVDELIREFACEHNMEKMP
jgi:hypothetical protein